MRKKQWKKAMARYKLASYIVVMKLLWLDLKQLVFWRGWEGGGLLVIFFLCRQSSC